MNQLPLADWKQAVCGQARKGNKDKVCTMLTERGVHIQDVSVEGRSLLHFAVSSGNSDLVRVLLSFRCDPNRLSPFGELPICLAASAGMHDIVEALAAGGADLNLRDSNGEFLFLILDDYYF
jgi:ankyrin repeat protein